MRVPHPRSDPADPPAAREARILALIEKYERLGLRDNRQHGHRPATARLAKVLDAARRERAA